MAIKKSLYVLLLLLIAPSYIYATDNELELPPVVQPEDFNRPVVQPTGQLTLQQAIILTLQHSPELADQAWSVRAREIDQLTAGLLPNPELGLEVENFAGTNNLSGFKSAETTLSISQLIELGGKRMKRQRLAAVDGDVARWKYEVKRVDLLAQVSMAFINVLSDQEVLEITSQTHTVAEEVYQTVSKRVRAGKVSPVEEIKARVELSKSRLALIKAQRQLTISKQSLVSYWGKTEVTFDKAVGNMDEVSPLPDLENLIHKLNANPDQARWMAEVSRQQNAVDLAQADTIPDMTLTLGVRHFNQVNNSDDVAAVAMISMPLFIFDKEQTGVQRSAVQLNQAMQQQQAAEVRIRTGLLTAWQRWQVLYDEASTLRDDVMPNAEQAFNTIKKTYRLGKIGLLELLDMQRTYFDVQQQYVLAKKEYHKMVVGIERLTGTPIMANDRQ